MSVNQTQNYIYILVTLISYLNTGQLLPLRVLRPFIISGSPFFLLCVSVMIKLQLDHFVCSCEMEMLI